MIKKIAFLLVVLIQTITFSQDYKFGKVSKEELEEKFHPIDSTAEVMTDSLEAQIDTVDSAAAAAVDSVKK